MLVSFYFGIKNLLGLKFLEKYKHLYKTCELWMQAYTKLRAMNNSAYVREQSYHYHVPSFLFSRLSLYFLSFAKPDQLFLNFSYALPKYYFKSAKVLLKKWGRVCTKIEGAYGRKAFCFGERGYIMSKKYLETPNIFFPNDCFLPVRQLGLKSLFKFLVCPHTLWINFTHAWYYAHRQDYQCSVQRWVRNILSTQSKLQSKAKRVF